MKFAYKVYHSESDKSGAKIRLGRALLQEEISLSHESLAVSLQDHIDSNPMFDVQMKLLTPSVKGAIVILEADRDSDWADAWIASLLNRLNELDRNLCLVAVPLPKA